MPYRKDKTMSSTSIDLTRFCVRPDDPCSSRYRTVMLKPWVFDDWQYATDGRILVRQPSSARSVRSETKYPRAPQYFADFPECRKRWPRKQVVSRVVFCLSCGNQAWAYLPIKIAGRKICGEYVLAIRTLGSVRYCADGGINDAIAFVCGDVQGVVNPIVAESEPKGQDDE
jgi:hypothetical protein